jgi:transposase InsO family protein
MESFFGTLKSEFFHLTKFTCLDGLKAGLDEYICYYNMDRIKLKLDCLNPIDYRIRHMSN